MNPITVMLDSLYLFKNNLRAFTRACLPVIVVLAVGYQALEYFRYAREISDRQFIGGLFLLSLLCPPLYSAMLFLVLDRNRTGKEQSLSQFLGAAVISWPACAALVLLVWVLLAMVLVMVIAAYYLLLLGYSALIIAACVQVLPVLIIGIVVRLVLAQPLAIIRSLGPLSAIAESFRLTRGHYWAVVGSLLLAALPLAVWAMVAVVFDLPRDGLQATPFLVVTLFTNLWIGTVTYRMATQLSEPPQDAPTDSQMKLGEDQPVA